MRRMTMRNAALALAGVLTGTAVAAGCLAGAAQPEQHGAAATATAGRAAAVQTVRTRLTALESAADRAGRVAEIADEAVLQHDTTANRAAADRAEAGLVTLAGKQTPELTGLLQRLTALGVSTAPGASDGVTATTTALVGRTKALRAVSYARNQIGDPYGFAKAGPGRWDCSGLTMKSYSAVKVSIGGHSATAQYNKERRQRHLVSYSHKRPGDLIFYGSPGSVYHVAIYAGHGRMIEAPYPGKRVREVKVRSGDRLSKVGRPA
jgi:cell wall-associated NlpC family hydrolase